MSIRPRKRRRASRSSWWAATSTSCAAARKHAAGEVRLRLDRLSLPADGPFAVELKDISLDVRAGEVVAIAGVAGNGQSEFFDAVSGERILHARLPCCRSTASRWAATASTRGARRARPSCRRSGWAMARCRASRCRRMSCSPAIRRTTRWSRSGLVQRGRRLGRQRPGHQGLRRAQGQARSRGARRSRAATCRNS